MLWVAIIGLVMTAVAVALAGRRVLFLFRLATSGQPAPERIEYAKANVGAEIKTQLVDVFGQRKLLKWTPSGTAHFFVMWAFFILASVYLEAYGALIQGAITGTPDFHIPIIGTWAILGFLQDFIAVAALVGLIAFAVIRVKNSPKRLGRDSRFSGSHLGGAWLTLFMIFNVIWTMFLFRGAAVTGGSERVRVFSLPELMRRILGGRRENPGGTISRSWQDVDKDLAMFVRGAITRLRKASGMTRPHHTKSTSTCVTTAAVDTR